MKKNKMNKAELIAFVTKLSEECPEQNHDEIILQNIKDAFDIYLKDNPQDIDILLLYALFFYEVVFEDVENAIEILEKVLQISPFNPYALLILAYIYHYSYSGIEANLVNQLEQVESSDQIMSMIELARAWYFESIPIQNEKGYEESLLKSVALDSTSVENNFRLGEFYLEKGDTVRAYQYLRKAKSNIGPNKENSYLPSVQGFLDEKYRRMIDTQRTSNTIDFYFKKIGNLS